MKKIINKTLKFLTLAFALCLAISAYAEKKPNIIFILTDDLGSGDLGCLNSNSKIKTPVLDNMAANGMTFTDAHTSSSVCTPSRYSIMTGRYNWRSTLKSGVIFGYDTALIPADRATMASVLKEAGYNTAMIGKWHLGWDWAKGTETKKSTKSNPPVDFSKPIKNGPTERGFDYFYGLCGSLDMPPYVYVENDMPTETSNDKKLTREGGRYGPVAKDLVFDEVLANFVDRSCAYIKEQAKGDKPFFLYLPVTGPHTPLVPSKEFKGKTGMGDYADYVENIDNEMAKIFKTLQEAGIEDNTIVVFTSDNGCSKRADFANLAKFDHDPNNGLRGSKSDSWEGGHRVPCLVQWKGKFGKSVANQTICLTDFFRTFADIAGYKVKDNEGEDSVDIMSIFEDPTNAPQVRSSTIHSSITGCFSIRMGDWKLLVHQGSGGWTRDGKGNDNKSPLQLYNLKDDLGELNNLYKQNPEKAKEMLAQLRKEIDDGRSTEGAKQKNEVKGNWKQLEAIKKKY